jgi:hypothetical protein
VKGHGIPLLLLLYLVGVAIIETAREHKPKKQKTTKKETSV